jgi:phosphate transport system substrate-binding protein
MFYVQADEIPCPLYTYRRRQGAILTPLITGVLHHMSLRLARLLSVTLIGACLSTSAFAAKTTHTKHAKTAVAAKGPSLIWRGDVATAQGVVDEVALAWQKAGHGSIELQPFNTASGIDAVSSGAADLAGSARPSDGSAENAGLTFTPVAWDALVMVTNPANPVHNLTLKQLHDIYYGKITNWSEVGGSSAPIDLYAVASPGDGVEYSLRTLLFGHGNQPVAAPRLYVNTHKLEEGVGLNPNGLGAATMADAEANPKLKMIPINGISPTAATVGNGSYVLFTPLYLVTNPHNPKAADVTAFIDFLQTDAAKAAMRRHGVIPFGDGAALAAVDVSRRGAILAETGGHASHIMPVTVPSSAPAASEASRTAVASAVTGSIAAGSKGMAAAPVSTKTQITDVKGTAEVRVTSLAHVKGSVLTAKKSKAESRHAAKNAAEDAPAKNRKADVADVKKSSASEGGKTYTVAKGDTLFSIAKKHSIEVAQLRDWNHLKDNNVKLGQSLRVGSR